MTDEQAADVQRLLTQVQLELVDVPALEDLTAVEPPFSPMIMGLFRGLPIEPSGGASHDVPARPEPART